MEKIIPDYLQNLSSFLQKTSYSEIPENVLERSRLVFADSMAAIIGGSAEPEVETLTKRMLLSKNPDFSKATYVLSKFPLRVLLSPQ